MTALFWLLAALVAALSLVPVVRPLAGRTGTTPADPRAAAYRARLSELEQDAGAGVITEEEARLARLELERELLSHADTAADALPADAGSARWAMAAAAVAAIAALALYLGLGRPDLLGLDTHPDTPAGVTLPELESMVEQLAQRLARQPDDARGWEMLGRSYLVLGRQAEAVAAFARWHQLEPGSANAMVRYADALARQAGGRLEGEPALLIDRALAVDPDHHTGLWLAGMAAMQDGDAGGAVVHWQRLRSLVKDDAQSLAEIDRLIELATQRTEATTGAGETAGARVRLRVELDPSLAGRVQPQTVLFVVARASGGGGMPVAVSRHTVSELPLELELDDSLALQPANRLSMHDTVDVLARTSRDGSAERQPGDLVGELHATGTRDEQVHVLRIDRVIP